MTSFNSPGPLGGDFIAGRLLDHAVDSDQSLIKFNFTHSKVFPVLLMLFLGLMILDSIRTGESIYLLLGQRLVLAFFRDH